MISLKHLAVLTLSIGACESTHIMGKSDHLTATASGIETSAGGGFTVKKLSVVAPAQPRVLFTSAQLTIYREHDGQPGFTSPPDQLVSQHQASSPLPSTHLTISSITTSTQANGIGNTFELIVVDENGDNHTFSGTI
jgi:hypothetical protein